MSPWGFTVSPDSTPQTPSSAACDPVNLGENASPTPATALHQGGRLVVAISEANQGQRVSVRYLLQGQAPGEQDVLFTDVLGHLEQWGPTTAGIRRKNGQLVEVEIAKIVAAKVIPPEPKRRSSSA